eukprot:gnl/MRDRNA2_/MRDRNA2_41091_c0_seq1.p1 gnl/MRDRNA2_/MRDRNA2_41091_c0~~gnl/MRDRNA2_/MRDRNA2_41091_c0_seq1.p1  ORF type:complete len:826 (+),score=163.69 gnl/MRDRNA2_/MRDRNA2_41091_c0_seq1:228-2705(+)
MSESIKEPLICENGGKGLVLPLIENEADKIPNPVRIIMYIIFLLWVFMGVAIISDIFMGAIETITAKKKRVRNKETGKMVTVKVWNDTVANLTLMALGSSAPEILLSVIELLQLEFHSGDLGPSTIVGSAAFNLLMIVAVCIAAIPNGEVRKIRDTSVYAITATFSIFAYTWMLIVLQVHTPDIVEPWEGILTLIFFPVLVGLAYLADAGILSSVTARKSVKHGHVIAADVSKEELASMMSDIRRKTNTDMSDEKILHLLEKQAEQKMSRAAYRIKATRTITRGRTVAKKPAVKNTSQVVPAPSEFTDEEVGSAVQPVVEKAVVQFAYHKYTVLENAGKIDLVITRSGKLDQTVKVHYRTREGTAKAKTDYVEVAGDAIFPPDVLQQTISVQIVNDSAFEEDEQFYVTLSNPSVSGDGLAILGDEPEAEVTIIDDDEHGILVFEHEEIYVTEETEDKEMTIKVIRKHGATGKVSCQYRTEDDSARASVDYEESSGELEFEEGQSSATIPLTIKSQGRYERTDAFRIILEEPTGGVAFHKDTDGGDDSNICTIHIKPGAKTTNAVDNGMKLLQMNWEKAKIGTSSWSEQFQNAIYCNGSSEEHAEASAGDKILHYIAMPWKLIFAFVPPTVFYQGWVCFWVSLIMIGVVTALIGDVANLVGCTMSISAPVTAITFVALGTSLPDTFASKTAAQQDPYADASVGNVTGSNSVNVFLGLGLSWSIGAIYWNTQGATEEWKTKYPEIAVRYPEGGFAVPAGSLSFSVAVFTCCAAACIALLAVRRQVVGGELGGEGPIKYASSAVCAGLWFLYIGIAAWNFEREAAEGK